MTELLPTEQAHGVRQGLLDYLTTTFALADQDARLALSEFLEDSADGIFKGPYLRLRLAVPGRGRRAGSRRWIGAAAGRRTVIRPQRSRGCRVRSSAPTGRVRCRRWSRRGPGRVRPRRSWCRSSITCCGNAAPGGRG